MSVTPAMMSRKEIALCLLLVIGFHKKFFCITELQVRRRFRFSVKIINRLTNYGKIP